MINLAFESSWNFFYFTWERVWSLSLFNYGYIEFSLSPFAFGFPSFLLATGAEVLMDIKTQCLFVKHHVFFFKLWMHVVSEAGEKSNSWCLTKRITSIWIRCYLATLAGLCSFFGGWVLLFGFCFLLIQCIESIVIINSKTHFSKC